MAQDKVVKRTAIFHSVMTSILHTLKSVECTGSRFQKQITPLREASMEHRKILAVVPESKLLSDEKWMEATQAFDAVQQGAREALRKTFVVALSKAFTPSPW